MRYQQGIHPHDPPLGPERVGLLPGAPQFAIKELMDDLRCLPMQRTTL